MKETKSVGTKGEQTYCRKQLLDKMPKFYLGYFAENFQQEYRSTTKCRKFSNS
jgi:hypothetical protein